MIDTAVKKKRILVIDDEVSILNVVKRILGKERRKYIVETETNGLKIGYLADEFCPDLVILDIDLPWIDGFRVCRIIKKIDSGIKVLAISGYDIEKTEKKIIECGADAFLPKPFQVKELKEFVNKLID